MSQRSPNHRQIWLLSLIPLIALVVWIGVSIYDRMNTPTTLSTPPREIRRLQAQSAQAKKVYEKQADTLKGIIARTAISSKKLQVILAPWAGVTIADTLPSAKELWAKGDSVTTQHAH